MSSLSVDEYDVIVLGGGAAGLMCALTAGQRGKRVLVLEVSNKIGKKILMSGGGRCNFTNLEIEADYFICANPHFVKSALSQYSQWDFIDLVNRHAVAYHEKSQGQLFCDTSAKDILEILVDECSAASVEIKLNVDVRTVNKTADIYSVFDQSDEYRCANLVVATGGLSIPTLGGATGLGYQLAQQFGLSVSQTEASLVPMTLTGQWHDIAKQLSGVAIPVMASVANRGFKESMLFTHRGLSGPAILQLSNYWYLGEPITIDLLPEGNVSELLLVEKNRKGKTSLSTILGGYFPKSLVVALQDVMWPLSADIPIQQLKDAEIKRISASLHEWELTPSGTEGYRTAEVTRGGVEVGQVSSKTMQVIDVPGLFMIGEVLGVTGHLGGYNFQWAWSSGYVAGMNV